MVKLIFLKKKIIIIIPLHTTTTVMLYFFLFISFSPLDWSASVTIYMPSHSSGHEFKFRYDYMIRSTVIHFQISVSEHKSKLQSVYVLLHIARLKNNKSIC